MEESGELKNGMERERTARRTRTEEQLSVKAAI
jgi:hypothetical protein